MTTPRRTSCAVAGHGLLVLAIAFAVCAELLGTAPQAMQSPANEVVTTAGAGNDGTFVAFEATLGPLGGDLSDDSEDIESADGFEDVLASLPLRTDCAVGLPQRLEHDALVPLHRLHAVRVSSRRRRQRRRQNDRDYRSLAWLGSRAAAAPEPRFESPVVSTPALPSVDASDSAFGRAPPR